MIHLSMTPPLVLTCSCPSELRDQRCQYAIAYTSESPLPTYSSPLSTRTWPKVSGLIVQYYSMNIFLLIRGITISDWEHWSRTKRIWRRRYIMIIVHHVIRFFFPVWLCHMTVTMTTDVDSTTWYQHQKHVFVLSISGKPVYSRYGKEDKLVNMFGIMQAIVSFFQDDNDNLRSIVAGGHRFVFMCRGPLVLVSVSQSGQLDTQVRAVAVVPSTVHTILTHKYVHTHTWPHTYITTHTHDHTHIYTLDHTHTYTHVQLAIQLNYVYYQVLSVLTNTQLTQRFEKKAGFDLRYLLQGSEKFIDNILNITDTDPSFILNGVS